MTNLNKLLLAASLLTAFPHQSFPQETRDLSLVVHTSDGSRTYYATGSIDSLTLREGIVPAPTPSGKVSIHRNVVFLGHSIWRNDNYTVRYANSGTFVSPFAGQSFTGRGYQTLLREVFDFESVSCPGPDGGYSGYSLGGVSKTDPKSIAVVANQTTNGWPRVQHAIWTIDFITNDFKRNVPIGTLQDYRNATGAATFYGALRQLYDRIRELSGEDVIVVCANALRRNNASYTSTSRNTAGHMLADYELALLTVASMYDNWYFVDQQRQSGITDENLPAVTADGVHLNNLGYRMAVQPWISLFRTLAQEP